MPPKCAAGLFFTFIDRKVLFCYNGDSNRTHASCWEETKEKIVYRKSRNSWTKHLDFMALDIICLQAAFFLAYILWQKNANLYSNYIYANLSIVLVLVDICVLIFLNTLKNVLKRGNLLEFGATARHVTVVILIAVLYLFSVKDAGDFSRMTLFLTALFYGIISYVVRLLWKRHVLRRIRLTPQKSIVIITDCRQLPQVREDIRSKSYAMFQVTGIAVLDGEEHVAEGTAVEGIPLVAEGMSVVDYILRSWVDEVFVDLPVRDKKADELLNQLSEMGVTIHLKLAQKLEFSAKKQFVERLGKYTVLTTSINTITTSELLLKRLVDIVGGLIGCVLTGVLFVFLAPAIYVQSPGPIIFSQTRIGENGKKFKLYKFRSMYPDAEERKAALKENNRVADGMMFKLDYDPRIIGCRLKPDGTVRKGIGNFIRDWSLDEFPQFWNVLKGDMSLVGTRPPTEDEWIKYDLHHRTRLAIKPGITGMWQVSGRSSITDFEKVVELDRYYIMNWDLGLDLKILAKTIPVVFGRKGSM